MAGLTVVAVALSGRDESDGCVSADVVFSRERLDMSIMMRDTASTLPTLTSVSVG